MIPDKALLVICTLYFHSVNIHDGVMFLRGNIHSYIIVNLTMSRMDRTHSSTAFYPERFAKMFSNSIDVGGP